jgi:hypothetical protein
MIFLSPVTVSIFSLWAGPFALPSPYNRTADRKFDKACKKNFLLPSHHAERVKLNSRARTGQNSP